MRCSAPPAHPGEAGPCRRAPVPGAVPRAPTLGPQGSLSAAPPLGPASCLSLAPHLVLLPAARATLEILIPDFVKQTSEEKPRDSEELEVSVGPPLASGRGGRLSLWAGPSRRVCVPVSPWVRGCICRIARTSRCADSCVGDEPSRQRLRKLGCSLC